MKTGFEFATAGYKSDKSRFIAKCAAEGCPWRIHASTIFDKKTVQVHFFPEFLSIYVCQHFLSVFANIFCC